ncbi:jerky protein homolog-like [Leptopilina boulardi]|uniref:jerky protein homolog-like n=1 Tax=Leptopilina boulardi TaxID=63433 RepID=UPI0021F607D4|nr:jerky protein homolog-like [Leptopilina boulardi]
MEKLKASQGWLHRFKIRNGIRQITCKGEKASADHDGSVAFQEEMTKFLEKNDYTLAEETEAFGFKVCKERVTIMTSANATGSHQVPLLLIGKSENPRCLKILKDKLPLIYKAQKKSWMTREIFLDWYKNVFIPDPMDQGAIESMKRHYKQLFLQKILFEDCNSSATIVSFIKKWKLSDTIFLAVSAWDLVTQQTLSMAWKNLLGLEFIEKSSDVTEEITTLNQIHRSQTYSTSEVEEWIAQDNSLPTWNQLSLDQLIEKETTGNTDFEKVMLKKIAMMNLITPQQIMKMTKLYSTKQK